MRGGGAERVMSVICNKMIERNHDVYLATDLSQPIAYQLDSKINLIDINVKKKIRFLEIAKRFKTIRSVAKKTKPDVIISFVWKTNFYVILSTLGLSIPVIASERSTFIWKMTFFEKIARFHINKLAQRVTVLTNTDMDFLKSKLKNTILIPNFSSFRAHEKNDILERKKNIIAIGNRPYIKGFDNLMIVWGQLSHKYPEWKLEIYGSGNTQELDNLIDTYQLSDSVKLMGFSSNIDEIMRKSSIFVLSSRYEGFPNVLIEAMSQGCACISFDCNAGPRDIITDNKSGLLVKDQDLKEMEKSLELLITDEKLRERLSVQAREEVKRFDPDTIVDKWENLCLSLYKNKI